MCYLSVFPTSLPSSPQSGTGVLSCNVGLAPPPPGLCGAFPFWRYSSPQHLLAFLLYLIHVSTPMSPNHRGLPDKSIQSSNFGQSLPLFLLPCSPSSHLKLSTCLLMAFVYTVNGSWGRDPHFLPSVTPVPSSCLTHGNYSTNGC